MLESYDPPLEGLEANNLKIIDSKITKLELSASFDSLLTYPVEIWSLEYRLKSNNINNVILSGGVSQEDDWITEYIWRFPSQVLISVYSATIFI